MNAPSKQDSCLKTSVEVLEDIHSYLGAMRNVINAGDHRHSNQKSGHHGNHRHTFNHSGNIGLQFQITEIVRKHINFMFYLYESNSLEVIS